MSLIVSIIIPIYNVEPYLKKCLESIVLLLKNTNIEIICVNDGSTDNSNKIINEYHKNYDRLNLINQKNSGLSAARNAGLRIAKGEYVAFIDSDDYIDAEKLIEIAKYAQSKNSDIAVGDYWEFDDDCPSNKVKQIIPASIGMSYSGLSFFQRFYKPLRSVVWRNIYKRSFLIDNYLWFHEGVCFEDVEFTPIAFSKATQIVYTGIPFYYYRKRNNSITTSKSSDKKVKDAIKIWQILNKESNFINNKSVASIFRELGFHSFMNQYSILDHNLSDKDLSEAKTLCSLNMKTFKYNLSATLFKILPDNIFHNILKRMR